MSAEWSGRRRAATWANVILQCVLLGALLAVVSLLARAHARRFDVSSRGTFRISAATEDLLRRLNYDVTIWINDSRYSAAEDKSLDLAIERTRELLKEFRLRNPERIKVVEVSKQGVDPALRQHFAAVQPATLYFLADLGNKRINKRVLEVYQLYHGDHATGELAQYRGEPAIAQSIRELGGTVRRVLYETEGHGEISTADKMQMGVVRELLSRNEGVEFRSLDTAKYKSIPADCDLLAIFGPAQPFGDEEIGLLKDYVERGGSLLVALRPRGNSGLEAFLEGLGAKVGQGIVLDPPNSVLGNPSQIKVGDFNVHDINQGMAGLRFVMADTCVVDPVEKGKADWKVTPLAMSGPESWEETGPVGPGTRPKPDGKERTGPLKLLVAIEKPASRPQDDRHKIAKVVVWGSVRPFHNEFLSSAQHETQWSYIINHVRWLIDRELMEIKHDAVSVKPLEISEQAMGRLSWLVLGAFPACALLLGVAAWILRRK